MNRRASAALTLALAIAATATTARADATTESARFNHALDEATRIVLHKGDDARWRLQKEMWNP